MIIFFSAFFTVYLTLNYYIFIRGWQALEIFPQLRTFYLAAFVILSLSYIAAKFLSSYLPSFIYDLMLWIGSFWFAFMVYFFFQIITLDLLRLCDSLFGVFPPGVLNNYPETKFIAFAAVFIISVSIIAAGFINAGRIKVKTLNLELAKKGSELEKLNAVMVSDIHLSAMDNEKFLSKIVDKINDLKPDIIFMPGDIVDDKAETLRNKNIGKALLKVKPKYGSFASTGNHEFISGINDSINFIKGLNLQPLCDSSINIAESVVIIGREDRSKRNFTGTERKSLEELLCAAEKDLPTILLDHTPINLNEAVENKIDLQLSGHTHNGQLFPLNFVTRMIYEISWGYLKKGDTQFYISCGAGTWGPRIKVGSISEIVHLKIKFTDS